jgi:hypothetical protein
MANEGLVTHNYRIVRGFAVLLCSCQESYAMTIDEIEALTHIDFFFSLPDKIEDEVEARINDEIWF